MSLSIIVIARDSERTIRRCLESVAWADEIVLVDSGSTDRTVEIGRELGARVSQTADWPGHGPQKNRALDLATGDWVFSLDSDEWITPEVRAELEAAMAAPGGKAAYMLPRRSSFCGRFMRHSGWWPDYVKRLFRRGTARFSDDQGHDRLIVDGTVGRLTQPILHETITSLDQLVDKMNTYSAMTARNLQQRGRRASIFTALFHGGWAFFRTYFLRAGFLDGREGLMLAVANAENSYYRYCKLMLLAEKSGEPPAASGRS
jgi:glycosyltransferase involved in cell wall biosynthesis